MILAGLSIIYLVGIGICSHIFRKVIKWVKHSDSITPTAKAIWFAIIWPIVLIPIITWFAAKKTIRF
jgi:hypothetical protein